MRSNAEFCFSDCHFMLFRAAESISISMPSATQKKKKKSLGEKRKLSLKSLGRKYQRCIRSLQKTVYSVLGYKILSASKRCKHRLQT